MGARVNSLADAAWLRESGISVNNSKGKAKKRSPKTDDTVVDAVTSEDIAIEEEQIATNADANLGSDAQDDTADARASSETEGDTAFDAKETFDETDPEPADLEPMEAAPLAAAAPIAAAERRSAMPMILAGLLLAGIGYIVGRGDLIDDFLPPSWRAADQVAELRAEMTSLLEQQSQAANDEIAALGARLDELPTVPDLAPVTTEVETLAGRVQTLEDTPVPAPIITTDGTDLSPINNAMQDLDTRLASLEGEDYAGAFDELRATAQTQQEQIATLLDEAKQAEDDAEAAANETRARIALERIRAALDAGQPFASDVNDFAQTGLADVPAELTDVADKGVATLGALQVSVSDAARDALASARSAEGASAGLGGFLERQLGVRSLAPKEGDDPDAVLSRVVASMESGDLQSALSEAEQLPEAARDTMSGWLTNAQARANALTAAAELSASLPTN